MATTKEDLIEAVLAWWNEHEYDADGGYPNPDGDGFCDQRNRYNTEPEFVKIAKELKEIEDLSGNSQGGQ